MKKTLATLTITLAAALAVSASTSDMRCLAAMPEEDITGIGIPADQAELSGPTLEQIRAISLSDVSGPNNQTDCIRYIINRKFLQASDDGKFYPDNFVLRSDLLSALYQIYQTDQINNENADHQAPTSQRRFSDVPVDAPYANAITWAVQNGIATGKSDGTFAPLDRLTRGQLAVFLYRFAGQENLEDASAFLTAYRDYQQVSKSNQAPMTWALKNHLFAALISDMIYPDLPVSRGQLAQVLTALIAYQYPDKEPLAVSLTEQMETKTVQSISRTHHAEIQSAINATAAKYGATGLQAAVIENGVVTDSYVYGWATKNSAKMTENHKIRAASITKVVIGMAAEILREEGKIDLDASIGNYWGVTMRNPNYPDIPISIRTLLSHTSSIRVFSWDTSRSYQNVRSLLQSSKGYSNLKPGNIKSWGYNNYAFGVLGQTLELASGKYLDEILNDRIWSILNIDAAFESGSVKNKDLLATLYENGKVFNSQKTLLKNTRPSSLGASGDNYSGGLTISALDLAKMTTLLINNGSYEGLQLLGKESVGIMESRYDSILSDGTYQALPLRAQDNIYGRKHLYYHTGSGYGVYNWLSYDPDTGDGVVILTTGARGTKDSRGIYAVCSEIGKNIYQTIAANRS